MFDFLKSPSAEERLKKHSMELDAIGKTMARLQIQNIPPWLFWKLVELQLKIDSAHDELKPKLPIDTTNVIKLSDKK